MSVVELWTVFEFQRSGDLYGEDRPPTVPAAVGEATIMCEGPQDGSWGSVNWSHPAGDIVYRCRSRNRKENSKPC